MAVDPTSSDRREGHDLTITIRPSRNPLYWLLESCRILVLTTAFVGFTVLSIGVFIQRTPLLSSLQTSVTLLAGLLAALAGILLFWVVRRLIRFDHRSYVFADDRLEIVRTRGPTESYAYDSIRHIGLPRLGELWIDTFESNQGYRRHTLSVPRTIGEEALEACVEQVSAQVPGHLFSIQDHSGLTYSVEPDRPTLFPELQSSVLQVREGVIHNEFVRVDQLQFDRTLPFVVRHQGGETEISLSRAAFRTRQGHVVGIIESAPHLNRQVTLYDGNSYLLQADGVTLEGEQVATFHPTDAMLGKLIFIEPLPTPIALLLTLALRSEPHLLWRADTTPDER